MWGAAAERDAGPVLVTGAAGFVGYHLAARLLDLGRQVVGLDNLTPYYDVALKEARLARLTSRPEFGFERVDLADGQALEAAFRRWAPRVVVNLAAQAGVRHSIENPHAYGASNLVGFLNVLEACRHHDVGHLVYASSSSVYGGNTALPFSVGQSVDHPVSLYAATKKANELMAHSYSHLYGLPATGLRFFTVYGPWGRPDMAYYSFTERLFAGEEIALFNGGDMGRDFTFIDDIVEAMVRLVGRAPEPDPAFDRQRPDPARSWAPHRVFNIGNRRRERLRDFLAHLERLTGRKAKVRLLPMQPGDVKETWADVADLEQEIGFRPDTSLADGLATFVAWFRDYHRV